MLTVGTCRADKEHEADEAVEEDEEDEENEAGQAGGSIEVVCGRGGACECENEIAGKGTF